MRKRKRKHTKASDNFGRNGLLKDGRSYRAKKSALDLKTIKAAGVHQHRTGSFAKLIDDINH